MEPLDGKGGAPDLSVLQVSCGACVILIPLALSFLLDLGVTSQIFVGGSRTALQLSLLGYILSFIFDVDHPAIVLCYLSFMATAAAYEACSKAPKVFDWMFAKTMGLILCVVTPLTFFVNLGVMRSEPWYNPRCLIPVTGMLLGQTVNSCSLAFRAVMLDSDNLTARSSFRMAMGASVWEAFLPEIRETVRTAILPMINSMNLMGLVSIPGMMTGQILAGAPAHNAAMYQLVIAFSWACACSVCSFLAALMTLREMCPHAFIDAGRLREKKSMLEIFGIGWGRSKRS